jgi:hypothetical protein
MSTLNNNNEGAVEHGTLESNANQRGSVSATLPDASVEIAVVPPEEDVQGEVLMSDKVGATKFAGCLSQGIPKIFTLVGTLQYNGQTLNHSGEPTGRSCRRSILHDCAGTWSLAKCERRETRIPDIEDGD